ncbi:MAG: hypothetical protein Q8942_17905 [Bacillota bacterium]|nr:hypothetical protein [Bacillota bacterium]
METIQEKLKNMETTELLRELAYGKEAFQEHIYELYMQEAIDRGIVDEKFSDKIEVVKEENSYQEGKKLLDIGIFTLIIFLFLGIPSFIIGLKLNKRNNDGTYAYDEKIRKNAKLLIIIPACIWGFVLLIFLLLMVL